MQDYLAKQGIDPYSAEGRSLMNLASAAIGSVGGGAGAATALQGEQYNRQLHPDYVQHLQSEAETFAAQQCGCDLNQLSPDDRQAAIDNATQSLLVTAQRMQDDSFNTKFDGVPLDSAARAFINKDNFGEYIGGTYYNLSQATADERSNPTINAYALYTQLNKDNNGGIGAMMAATGYTLGQYAGLAQADYNSGRPQGQAFDVGMQNWNNQDALSFLNFNGKIALMGGSGGLSGGVPLLAAAYDGTKVGTALQFIAASRAGAAVTSASVNTVAQLAKNGGHVSELNPIDIGASALGGSLGVGGGFWWNVGVGAGVGTIQTAGNNWYQGGNDSLYVGAVTGAVANGSGYWSGAKLGDYLGKQSPT
ncbi:MAG: hypothetical protein ACRDRT_14935, partial [Pseudonocardiaceae bacterium]